MLKVFATSVVILGQTSRESPRSRPAWADAACNFGKTTPPASWRAVQKGGHGGDAGVGILFSAAGQH